MSTVTAYKLVGDDYKSWMIAGPNGPLSALQLTYTIGTTVTANLTLGASVKGALRAAMNHGRGPTEGEWLHDLSDHTGLRAFSTVENVFRAAADSWGYWTPSETPTVRVVKVHFDSVTDVIEAIPHTDAGSGFEYRLTSCHVDSLAFGPNDPVGIG